MTHDVRQQIGDLLGIDPGHVGDLSLSVEGKPVYQVPADGMKVLSALKSTARPGQGQADVWMEHYASTVKRQWIASGQLIYKLPADQLPYLRAIDLGDVMPSDIQTPAVCMRFDRATDHAYLYRYREADGTLVLILTAVCFSLDWSVASDLRFVVGDDTTTLAQAIAKSVAESGEVGKKHAGTISDWWACICNTLFLRTAKPEYFRHEVLQKPRPANFDALIASAKRKGDTDTVEILRAKHRRSEVYTFHTGASWLADIAEAGEPLGYTPYNKRGEMTKAYIVRGHIRRQRYGKGNAQVKVILIPPQVRRADLIKTETEERLAI